MRHPWVLVLLGLLVAALVLIRPARAEEPEAEAEEEALPEVAGGQGLEDVRKRGTLIWGADQEGGGPYVWPKEDNPEEVIGFEVDIAEKLAEYLKVKPQFYQGNWDKLGDLLRAGKFDVVLNGYEYMPIRAELMEVSMPYYVYGLQMLAKKDDPVLKTFEDILKPRADGRKTKIALLSGSAAEEYMAEQCPEHCELIAYDGVTDAMREVENGKLDATLQDTPIAAFYGTQFPGLHYLGAPVAPGYYVMYARKGDVALMKTINEAIILMIRNGDFERIYRKYDMWDDNQKELLSLAESAKFFGYMHAVEVEVERGEMLAEETVQTSVKKSGWSVVSNYGEIMVKSAGMTVILAVISFPIAILIGLFVAVGRLYGPAFIRVPLTIYVEFLRGTPLMLQLYFIFFFLPELGLNISAFPTAIIGLALNYSAYESEIYRAGLQAIPGGQMEAALSLGMSRWQAIFSIVVPQAFRIVIPPMVNDFIALFKDTSVCSVVTIIELTKRFTVLAMSSGAIVEMMLMTAVLYMAMSVPMSYLARHLEKRLGASS